MIQEELKKSCVDMSQSSIDHSNGAFSSKIPRPAAQKYVINWKMNSS